jgi:DNA-binding NtrC family response regulator
VRNAIERDYIGALKRGEPINLADLVKQFENQLIETALQATEGKIMRAADARH